MTDKRIKIMSEYPPAKAILVMSLPVVLGMIVQVFYNLVDTFFIGQLGDSAQLAAASIATPVFMIIMAISSIVGTGAASYVSRCLGSERHEEADKTLVVSMGLCCLLSALVTVFGLIFGRTIIKLLGTSSATYPFTYDYVIVLFAGSFAIIGNFALGQLMRSEGSTKLSMFGMMIGTVTNIILDPLFIFSFKMGIRGAAIATVLGNLFALIFYLYCYLRKKTLLQINIKLFSFDKKILWEIVSIGVPATLNQLLVSVAMMVCNNIASTYGDIAVAAMGISQKLMTIGTFVFMGFGAGCQPLMGFNYGANNYKRMFGLLKTGIALTSGVGVAIAAIFGIFAPALIGIFSPDAEVVAAGITILRAVMFSLPFLGGTQLSTVTVQAMGKPVYALLLSISRQGILYIPLLLLLNTLGGFQGFIYAQAITDLLMLFVASVVLFFILKKDNANNEQIPLMYDGKMSTANYPKG